MSNKFMSIREASDFLRVSQSAIRLWISQGRLKAVKAGSRVLIDREYLEQRAASGRLLELVNKSKPTTNDQTGGEPRC